MRRPLCSVCLIFVILIILITEIFPYKYEFSDITVGELVLIEGKVSQKQIKNINGQTIYLIYLEQIVSRSDSLADNISDKDSIIKKLNNTEGIICYMSTDSLIPNIGSTVLVEGKVSTFEVPDNPGEFNAPLYYKINGVDARMFDCKLVAYSENYSVLQEKLFRFKNELCKLIDSCFRKEYRGIAKAILFAMNGELDEDTKELYQRNGMLHILCVSGLHISILGMGLFGLLKRMHLPDMANTVICISLMLLYGVMIGMGTSVFRAILMFAMRLVANLLERTYDLMTAACVGIFCILLEQPLYIYHSGFLLSFLSVVALGAFRPIFPDKICKSDFINKRADSFFSSLTVWLVTLPVYGRYYYEVSVSGLLLNVLILPFVGVVLVLVIAVCLLGGFYQPFGCVVARLCEVILWAFEELFAVFDRVGHTALVLGYIPVYKCALYFVGLTVLLFVAEKWKKRFVYMGLVALCAFMIIKVPKELTITCLSVGQGDSAVVEYKDLTCVIDAGSSSENDVSKYTILPFLKYQGVREVDYLFLTHSDADHINGVEELLRQSRLGIRIKRLVVTDAEMLDEYGNIVAVATEQGVPIYEMNQGTLIVSGDLKIECLGPGNRLLDRVGQSNNETSMVLLLEKGEFQMLFTGDMEGLGEQEIIEILKKRKVTDNMVLKVAHHGSKNSTSEEFLSVLMPQVSIISCGINNRYGHPHEETVERLEGIVTEIFYTMESGQITLQIEEGRITVDEYRE